jgi:5,5'-dehydrodivanillate O-demethylase oxygenase subunit
MFHLTVKMRAYPVQKFMGMYWAYLGPLPAPAIPKYDLWVRKDGRRKITVHPMLDCNWFQAMENSVDSAHLQILHQDQGTNIAGGRRALSTTRGFTDDVESFDFYELPYGIMKKRVYKNGLLDEHPLIFPNILRISGGTQIRVPIDDTHTYHYSISFEPTADGSVIEEEPTVRYASPYKEPGSGLHPYTYFTMSHVIAQDVMAWETQGPIADRSAERLSTSDKGVVMLRNLMRREIARAQRGEDPMSVVRDPDHAMIDTNLSDSLAQYTGRVRGPA